MLANQRPCFAYESKFGVQSFSEPCNLLNSAPNDSLDDDDDVELAEAVGPGGVDGSSCPAASCVNWRAVGRSSVCSRRRLSAGFATRVVRLVVDVAGARRAEEAAVPVLHQLVLHAVRRQRQGVGRVERNRECQHDGIGREYHEPLAQPDDVLEPGLDRVAQEENGQRSQRSPRRRAPSSPGTHPRCR